MSREIVASRRDERANFFFAGGFRRGFVSSLWRVYLLQSDYGIRVASIAGGTLKLQDELKFSFYVVARKQAENIAIRHCGLSENRNLLCMRACRSQRMPRSTT